MLRSIKLRWASSYYVAGRHDGVRLRVEVTCADKITDKIFAYRLLPTTPTGEAVGTFSHVCSPVDLEEYPETEPRANESPSWFRLSYVDVLVRSAEEANNFLQIIREDVRRLLETLRITDTLFVRGEDVYGEVCDPAPPVSSSSSESA